MGLITILIRETNKQYFIPYRRNMSLINLLEDIVQVYNSDNFTYKIHHFNNSGLGYKGEHIVMLDGIYDKYEDLEAFWILTINNTEIFKCLRNVFIMPGDIIEFRYVTYFSNSINPLLYIKHDYYKQIQNKAEIYT